jgi:hypothetical protein
MNLTPNLLLIFAGRIITIAFEWSSVARPSALPGDRRRHALFKKYQLSIQVNPEHTPAKEPTAGDLLLQNPFL